MSYTTEYLITLEEQNKLVEGLLKNDIAKAEGKKTAFEIETENHEFIFNSLLK